MEKMMLDMFDDILNLDLDLKFKKNYISTCLLGYIDGRINIFLGDEYMMNLLSKKRINVIKNIDFSILDLKNNKFNYIYDFGKLIGENNTINKYNVTRNTINNYERLLKSK